MIPSASIELTVEWSYEATIIAALMRRMGVSEITLTEDELHPKGGLILPALGRVVVVQEETND